MILDWIKTYIYRIIFIAGGSVILSLIIAVGYQKYIISDRDDQIQKLLTSTHNIKEELKQARDKLDSAVFEANNDCSNKNAIEGIKNILNNPVIKSTKLPQGEYTL